MDGTFSFKEQKSNYAIDVNSHKKNYKKGKTHLVRNNHLLF